MYGVDESEYDDESVWLMSTSLSSSVRSENCEVLHLNSNMVAASLKQSGLVTDRAYSHLTASEHTLTINALTFLLLLVQRCSNGYNLFIEAAQALCSRAMKPSKDIAFNRRVTKTGKNAATQSRSHHVSDISEQTNRSGKTAKPQEQPILAEDDLDNSSEKQDLANGDDENDSSARQGPKIFSFYHTH